MPFIRVPLDDIKEPEAVPEGEYDLRIVKSEDGVSKAGNEMTTVFIKIDDPHNPNAGVFRHWITYPTNETPADQRQMRFLDIKRFLKAFGIPADVNGFNSDDLVGATAHKIFLYQEESDDGNIYNKMRLPRLKE